MTVKDVIDGFREGAKENTERDVYANELFQEAVRIGMELNNQYHTPEELREIMGRLTGKKIDEVLQLEKWRSFVNGKVTGGLAVLEVLGIEKEKRIEVLAKALGLCTATATEYVNGFYEENYQE